MTGDSEGASLHEMARVVIRDVNKSIDDGDYECEVCGFEVGLIHSASCNQCGHIPEENRA